ncbi:RNA polymerase sigma factor [Patescibacteria group bacterium]|nr:RNA polymerase sigma factor [Patescibacteria group bacterium]
MHEASHKPITPDEDLVALARSDQHFFGMLVERYESKLDRYLKRITNVSVEDRQDMLQNIFIKVYSNLNGFDQSLSFSSWIYRIARNEAIDWSRRTKTKIKYGQFDTEDEALDHVPTYQTFLDELEIKEDRALVIKAMSDLKPISREVIILKYFEDKSYREISDILKRPVPTIATLIRRAKDELKGIILTTNHHDK